MIIEIWSRGALRTTLLELVHKFRWQGRGRVYYVCHYFLVWCSSVSEMIVVWWWTGDIHRLSAYPGVSRWSGVRREIQPLQTGSRRLHRRDVQRHACLQVCNMSQHTEADYKSVNSRKSVLTAVHWFRTTSRISPVHLFCSQPLRRKCYGNSVCLEHTWAVAMWQIFLAIYLYQRVGHRPGFHEKKDHMFSLGVIVCNYGYGKVFDSAPMYGYISKMIHNHKHVCKAPSAELQRRCEWVNQATLNQLLKRWVFKSRLKPDFESQVRMSAGRLK